MATHPVFLPGESHGQRSLAGYKSTGLQKSQTPLSDQHFNFQKRKLNDLSEVKSGCDTQDWARGPLSSWPRPSQEQGRPGQAAPQSPGRPSAWCPDTWDGGWSAWRGQAAELYLQLIHNTPSVYLQVGSGVFIHPRGPLHQVPSFINTTITMAYHLFVTWLPHVKHRGEVFQVSNVPMCATYNSQKKVNL